MISLQRIGLSPEGETRAGAALIAAALGACALIYAYPPLAGMFLQQSESYNEGWNAFHTARLLAGETLYPSIDSFIQNNYPPVSFYVVGAVSWLTGDTLIAGRLVALGSLLVVCAAMGVIVLRLTRSTILAGLAGLIIFAVIAGNYQIYVAYDDPQMLGHAFMALGALCLTADKLTRRRIMAASALMLLGGFTKHMLVALPAAASLWLLLRGRRDFTIWIAFSASAAVLALGACYLLYGGEFFSSVLGHQRQTSPGLLLLGLSGIFPLSAVILLGAFPLTRAAELKSPAGLLALATLVSVVVALLARSGKGVDANAYFDIAIYGAPAAILAIKAISESIIDRVSARAVAALLWLLLITPAVAPAPMRLPALVSWSQSQPEKAAAAKSIIEEIRAVDGDVACQRLAYCYWAGEPFMVDFFNIGQAASASPEISAAMDAYLASGKIAAIQLDRDWRGDSYGLENSLDAYYRPASDERIYGALYMPR